MATNPQPRMKAPARRDAILGAATEVIARRGFDAAAMRDIAERAGVTPPVLYDHFPSKQDLCLAVLDAQYTTLLEHFAPSLEPTTEGLGERIRAVAAGLGDFVAEQPDAVRVLFAPPPDDETIAVAVRANRSRMHDLARENILADPDFTPPPGLDRGRAGTILAHLQVAAYESLAQWLLEDQGESRLADGVAVFMDYAWIGLERLRTGEHWAGRGTA